MQKKNDHFSVLVATLGLQVLDQLIKLVSNFQGCNITTFYLGAQNVSNYSDEMEIFTSA